jgi:methionyl aminopeptidase
MTTTLRPALEPGALEKFREAGRIARLARELGVSMIEPGAKLRTVMEAVEDFIRAEGGRPAFPAQTSRNHIAAHYCPSPEDDLVYQAEDMVKIDIGVEVDGYIADNAQTKYLGAKPFYQGMVDASAAALAAAMDIAGPGVEVRKISAAIEEAITSRGYTPVYNLTGHGVARWKVHTAPQIPATPDTYGHDTLEEGMVIAIEPFATDGRGTVHEQGRSEIFMMHREPRKMKGIDAAVWKQIEAMNGLPFARRTFLNCTAEAIESTIARLLRTHSLMSFPPLVDPNPEARVAQTEHTMVVTADGVEATTA